MLWTGHVLQQTVQYNTEPLRTAAHIIISYFSLTQWPTGSRDNASVFFCTKIKKKPNEYLWSFWFHWGTVAWNKLKWTYFFQANEFNNSHFGVGTIIWITIKGRSPGHLLHVLNRAASHGVFLIQKQAVAAAKGTTQKNGITGYTSAQVMSGLQHISADLPFHSGQWVSPRHTAALIKEFSFQGLKTCIKMH